MRNKFIRINISQEAYEWVLDNSYSTWYVGKTIDKIIKLNKKRVSKIREKKEVVEKREMEVYK